MENLETFQRKPMIRRLKREYLELSTNCESIDVECIDNSEINIKIVRKEKGGSNNYIFKLSLNYPFVPPIITINDKTYKSFLMLSSKRFYHILRYIKGDSCLCCTSCCQNSNWTPAFTIQHILKEIDNIKETKYNIVLKILTDKIKEQYLIPDIDIDSWLFNIAKPSLILPGTKLINKK